MNRGPSFPDGCVGEGHAQAAVSCARVARRSILDSRGPMNFIYRLVWNRSLRVLQVTSEVTRASRGGAGGTGATQAATRCRLNARALAAFLLVLGMTSAAQGQIFGGNGGAGGDTGSARGGAGGTTDNAPGSPGGAGTSAGGGGGGGSSLSVGTGGNGGDGGIDNVSYRVGAGGVGGEVGSTTALDNSGTIIGRAGTNGGIAEQNLGSSGGSGGGGGGGFGLVLGGSGFAVNSNRIAGGAGGAGGAGAGFSEPPDGYRRGGGGGGGGSGGGGVLLTGGASFTNSGVIEAGRGGDGGAAVAGGEGGSGGDGGIGLASTAGGSVVNSGSIVAGAGGAPGSPDPSAFFRGGFASHGGTAVLVTGGGTVLNTGVLEGGNGGAGVPGSPLSEIPPGAGGAGVAATGNTSVTNSGIIRGGLSGDGATRANAIDFSGGNNTLTLQAGYSFIGNVVSTSGNTNGGDTLRLGGDTDPPAALNVSNIVANLPASPSGTQYVGFANFAKDGASTWQLTGNGSPAQNWSITGGTLRGDANTFKGNILFAPASGGSAPGVVFDQGSGNPNSAGSAEYAGRISGAGAFTKTGDGTLTLSGANTYTGGTLFFDGVVSVSSDANLGDAAGSLFFDWGVLRTTADLTMNRATTLLTGGTISTNAGTTLIHQGAIDGGGGLAKIGAGTLTLTGANTYSGGTVLIEGTLSISADQNLGAPTLLIIDGGTLRTTSPFATGRTIQLGLAGSTLQTDADLTATGQLGGKRGAYLIKTGTGTLTLTGSNSYTGGTRFDAGVVSVSRDANLGSASGGLVFNGGTLRTTADLAMNRATTLGASGGTFDTLAGTTLSQQGAIGGAGGLTKTGAGLLTLTGVNTYEGGTTISAGTLAGSAASFGSGAITNNAALLIDQASDEALGNTFAGSGALTKTGAGTLTLTGENSYSGGTDLKQGGIAVGNNSALGTGELAMHEGTTLR
ncbi:autotransporter-associated beta strand repeat-containing protein, partial [Variovorax sp. WDL1]|uniref:autotransporter-associated beta strand repeat-containing protein n=1 Tax=Variovorax sp. WDL1 TaxID=207745 RepID=UPI0018DC6C85